MSIHSLFPLLEDLLIDDALVPKAVHFAVGMFGEETRHSEFSLMCSSGFYYVFLQLLNAHPSSIERDYFATPFFILSRCVINGI